MRLVWMTCWFVLGSLFVLARPVQACSCMEPGPPCKAAAEAQAIFAGEVTEISEIEAEPGSGYRQRLIHFRVLEAFRGVTGKTVQVITGRGGGDCGFGFGRGGQYLVYAYAHQKTGRLYTGICSRTRRLTQADEDLEYLKPRGSASRGAGIEGRIIELGRDPSTNDTRWRGPMAGIRVTVQGQGRRETAVTDKEGQFRFWGLPEGKYAVRVALPAGFAPPLIEDVQISRHACGWVYLLATPVPFSG